MRTSHRRGFTLIELLTVIAIIAILASITFAALPRVLEKAKLRRMNAAMQQVKVAMTSYFTEHNTYPPGYGFIRSENRGKQFNTMAEVEYYYLKPYTWAINIHGLDDLYDEFSLTFGYDSNRDGRIHPMEFVPIGNKPLPNRPPVFPSARFTGSNVLGERDLMFEAEQRPFVYAPVYARHFRRAMDYWMEIGAATGDFSATAWDPNDDRLRGVVFPPPSYDAFVLISMGPGANTFGVVPADESYNQDMLNNFPQDAYHIMAMRTFFLATRDLNDNGALDFDFYARSRQGEAAMEYVVGGQPMDNKLPPPPSHAPEAWGRNGWGPVIFEVP